MRSTGDKDEVRAAIVRAATGAYPGCLERQDLDREPEIARADGRTVEGQLRLLAGIGCIVVLQRELPSGRALRFEATRPAAMAARAVMV